MWTMMNGSVCSTCQLLNKLIDHRFCRDCEPITDVTSHILQGLTVTPFKFHLLVPQAISTLSFVKSPGYEMNYTDIEVVSSTSFTRACMFLYLNNTYTSLLCFSSCFVFFFGGGVHDLQ